MAVSLPGQAHKAITSKYTFNEDVFPVFRDRCSRCHVDGGVAPMSLVNYQDAFPWAESMRVELLAETMPPWHTFDLSARELDVILVWASGGTPQGNAANKPPVVTLKNEWRAGAPDLALPLPAEFMLPADTMEAVKEFEIQTELTERRTLKAVDVLPGTPAIVRGAILMLKGGNAFATWVPGQDSPSPVKGAIVLPARAQLVLRVHYKKTWKQEGSPVPDRSTVGLYFSDAGTKGKR